MGSALEQLAAVPLLSGCSRADLRQIERASDQVDVEAGRVLCTEGELGREAFVLLSGAAEVRRRGEVVAQLGPGDWVGELALLDGGPRTATVTTTEPSNLLVLTRGAFNGVLDEVPTLAHKLLVTLARRLRAAEDASWQH
ncbi:MAG: cyclic nucleotide-binding domain-containing protein [Microthrixaceae bacterium]